MPERDDPLKALEIRRIMLMSEAELHREEIRREWADFKTSFGAIEGAFNKSARSIVSVASVATAAAAAFRRLREGRGGLGSRLLTGAGLASALWFAVRSRSR
jgi:hypothetical protein